MERFIDDQSLKTSYGLIPKLKFIEDIEEFMKGHEVQNTLSVLHELAEVFNAFHKKISATRIHLNLKIKQIDSAIKTVQYLSHMEEDKEQIARFPISPTLYSFAKIKNVQNVYLVLGADVMVQFNFSEASELLKSNQTLAETMKNELEEEFTFLTYQMKTWEVLYSRINNFFVLGKHRQNTVAVQN